MTVITTSSIASRANSTPPETAAATSREPCLSICVCAIVCDNDNILNGVLTIHLLVIQLDYPDIVIQNTACTHIPWS